MRPALLLSSRVECPKPLTQREKDQQTKRTLTFCQYCELIKSKNAKAFLCYTTVVITVTLF